MEARAFFTGGFSASLGTSTSPPSMDWTISPSSPGRFRFLYFLLSPFGSSLGVSSLMGGLGNLPLRFGGGVVPPFAALASASLSAFSLSRRSLVDMMPSFGGRPGPRLRGGKGWPSGPIERSGIIAAGLGPVVRVILVLVLPDREGDMLLSCSFEVKEVLLNAGDAGSLSSCSDSSLIGEAFWFGRRNVIHTLEI